MSSVLITLMGKELIENGPQETKGAEGTGEKLAPAS